VEALTPTAMASPMESILKLSDPRRKTMKSIATVFASVSCAALIVAGLAPNARADAWNKKTVITIDAPMQVPKKVLEPGKYVFKLADSQSDRHIVQIFSEDEKHLITTILAIPNYRLKVRGKSEFGFWETPPASLALFERGSIRVTTSGMSSLTRRRCPPRSQPTLSRRRQ
jgi:hypothetical protein